MLKHMLAVFHVERATRRARFIAGENIWTSDQLFKNSKIEHILPVFELL